MRKFKFRLATLLQLREATRDQRRAHLAEAYRVDEVLQQRLAHLAAEVRQLRLRCREVVKPGKVEIDQLVEAQRYELAMKAQENALRQQRQQVSEEIERRREALVEANREVRVLEKLRETQAQRHRQQEERQSVKELDEIAGRIRVGEEVR